MKYTKQYLQDLEDIQCCIPQIERLKGAKILVTGAGGLIGSAIIDFLLQLNDTKRFDISVYAGARKREKLEKRFNEKLSRPDMTYVQYDAMKPISLADNIDYIIHAASPANPAMYISKPVETMLSNFMGMYYALEFARANQLKRVLYISSSEVYGKKDNNLPYKEGEYGFVDILNPRACYPSSKRASETLCASYFSEYNVDSVIVRPGHVYGGSVTDEDNRASSQFLKDAAQRKNIIMKSAGSQLRSYCYVCDAVSAIFAVLLNGKSAHGYNISNPYSVCTIRELAECIAKIGKCKLLFDNPTEAESKSYNFMDNSSVDSSALLQLGWRGKFDVEMGVKHSIEMIMDSDV